MAKSIYYRQPYLEILIKKVKGPFKEAVDTLMDTKSNRLQKLDAGRKLLGMLDMIRNELPEPTLENVGTREARILVGIRDRFLKRLKHPAVEHYLRPVIDFVIIIVDTDLYRQFFNWWVWELKKSDWPKMGPMQPDPHFFEEEE